MAGPGAPGLMSELTQIQSFSPSAKPLAGLGLRRPAAAAGGSPVAILDGMRLDDLSDEQLVLQYRDESDPHRETYVNELFRRNYVKVARWCLRFSDDRESAKDLAQEIFARVYQNLGSFQGNSKFSTWLFTISRNHCLNVVRSRAREAAELRAELAEDFMDGLPDLGLDPHQQAEQKDSAHKVRAFLAETLDETEQAVFALHYGEDVPLEGVTRLLGLQNASGAKAYIVSAKRKLARAVPRWKASGRSIG